MTKSVTKDKNQSVRGPQACLAAAEPWAHFRAGVELAQSIERGRTQQALWLLDDGVCPPTALLGPALCVAARMGMSQVCERLLSVGASPLSYWLETPTLLGVDVDTSAGRWVQASHGCAALAMRGGDLTLTKRLLHAGGDAALGPRGACMGSLLRAGALSWRTGHPCAREAFMIVAQLRPKKEWPRSAALLCSAGQVEMALWMLDAADDECQLKMARLMLAPLCAYLPKDRTWGAAYEALGRCVALSAGKSVASIASGSIIELAKWSLWSEDGYDSRAGRFKSLSTLAWSSWDFPSRELTQRLACWPRAAALLCGNMAAFELLKGLSFGREELEAVRIGAQLLLKVFDGVQPQKVLPSFTLDQRDAVGRWMSPGSVVTDSDERDYARRALTLVESIQIEMRINTSKPRKMGKSEKKSEHQELDLNRASSRRFRL